MLSLLLGILTLSGAAQANDQIVTCRAGGQDTELVFERRGFHFPLPPKFVSARLGGTPVQLSELAEVGEAGREYFFRKGPYRFYVSLEGRFQVDKRLFGEPELIAEGTCDGRPQF